MNTLTAVQTTTAPHGVIRKEKKPYNEDDSLTSLTVLAIEVQRKLGTQITTYDFDESEYVGITYIALEKLYTDKDYQRLVNIAFIKDAEKFEPTLFRPVIVFKRPNGKLITCDGQQESIIGLLYTSKGPKTKVPCQVHEHPSDFTTKQCVAAEARFFEKINFNRINLGQVQKLRAGISYGDPHAIATEDKLIDMGVHIEKIGDPEGPEVYGLTKLLSAYSVYGLGNTIKAIQLYQKLRKNLDFPKWNDKGDLLGAMILGLAAIFHLKKEELGVGDKNHALDYYLDNYLGNDKPKDLLFKTAGNAQAILIARRIVSGCNNLINNRIITKRNGDILHHMIEEDAMSNAGLSDPSKAA